MNVTLPVGTNGTVILPENTASCVVDGVTHVPIDQSVELENGIHEIVISMITTTYFEKLEKSGKIDVYPNPVNEKLYINPNDMNIKNICIYDSVGTKIKEVINVDNSVDMTSLNNGVYLIGLYTGKLNHPVYKKIIKQ